MNMFNDYVTDLVSVEVQDMQMDSSDRKRKINRSSRLRFVDRKLFKYYFSLKNYYRTIREWLYYCMSMSVEKLNADASEVAHTLLVLVLDLDNIS